MLGLSSSQGVMGMAFYLTGVGSSYTEDEGFNFFDSMASWMDMAAFQRTDGTHETGGVQVWDRTRRQQGEARTPAVAKSWVAARGGSMQRWKTPRYDYMRSEREYKTYPYARSPHGPEIGLLYTFGLL
jgi:hypothetical protein